MDVPDDFEFSGVHDRQLRLSSGAHEQAVVGPKSEAL